MHWYEWVLAIATFTVVSSLLAILAILRLQTITDPTRPKVKRDHGQSTHLLIVLGSGGHTAEMIAMLERATMEKDAALRLDWQKFTHRTWIVSSGDSISADRARRFEDKMQKLAGQESTTATYDLHVIPRAREIHQPLYTAPISSLHCANACFEVLTQNASWNPNFPDLILCNGPATATVLIFISIFLRFFDHRGCNSNGKMRTVYVESWARVKKLSLSGRLLIHVVDRFLVQWPQLEKVAQGRAEFAGVLV